MSSDIKRRLRAVVCSPIHEEAAQAIEALEGENAALKEQFDNLNNDYGIELSRYAHAKAAAEVAEARAERLRVALEKIKQWSGLRITEREQAIHQAAVDALEDDKQ